MRPSLSIGSTNLDLQDLKALYTNVGSEIHANITYPPRLTAPIVDPWFNFRATKYLVKHGFYSFWDWFDDSGSASYSPSVIAEC